MRYRFITHTTMAIQKGPFTISWGDNELSDVESVDVDYTADSEDFVTLQGQTLEVDGNIKITAIVTLLSSDIPALAALLPQNFVPNGQDLSTGETVDNADGAIDVKARECDEDLVYNNFDIVSCDNPGGVQRIVNARTKLDGVEYSEKIRKVMVKIVGEAPSGEGITQFFREGTIANVS